MPKGLEIPLRWAEWRDRIHLKCCVRDIDPKSINIFVHKSNFDFEVNLIQRCLIR